MDVACCPPPVAVRCHIAAHAALRAPADVLARRRREPGPGLAPTLLRNSDDQTVAALAAVLDARANSELACRDLSGWGVVAACHFFGRRGIAQSAQKYAQEGAWGISPNLIPHHSLHAASGTISLALGLRGPNFGIGGGPRASDDAFLVAAGLLAEGDLPGLWLVLTGHVGEWVPAENGQPDEAPPCEAVALALTPAVDEGSSLRIGPCQEMAGLPEFRLTYLVDSLTATQPQRAWRLPGGMQVELELTAHGAGSRR